MTIHISDVTHDRQQSDALYEMLDVYSAEQGFNTRKLAVAPYLFVAHTDAGEFLGGIQGGISGGWMDIYTLYSTRTSPGVGTALLRRAEAHARVHGCIGIKLVTYPFQAPGYYERFGYAVYGQVPDLVNGYPIIYMKKELA